MNNDYRSPEFKSWLDKLQQESWQLELLISGFAIFGLFSAIEPINHNLHHIDNANSTFISLAWIVLKIACVILIFNLVTHVFLRGLWIGALGLRYVSGDIDYDALDYTPKFANFLKQRIGSFDRYISQLENYCSVLFAITFLSVFYVISFFAILFILALLTKPNQNTSGHFILPLTVIIAPLLLGATLTFIDFIGQGVLKKNKITSKIYYPIYRVFSIITLSFLYRPLVYNFLDNKFGKRILLLLVPVYIAFFYYISLRDFPSQYSNVFSKANSYPTLSKTHYDNALEDNDYVRTASIPSKTITTPYLDIFVKFNPTLDNQIIKHINAPEKFVNSVGKNTIVQININNPNRVRRKEADSLAKLYMETVNLYVAIKIDSLEFKPEYLLARNKKQQLGYQTVIPIQVLREGKHELHIKRRLSLENDSTATIAKIPFWYYPE